MTLPIPQVIVGGEDLTAMPATSVATGTNGRRAGTIVQEVNSFPAI